MIIDEAHRLRNVYKSSNVIGQSIKSSLHNSQKVLLTATPLQNSLLELYGLVSIIDDYAFGDIKSFKSQYSRLQDEMEFDDLKERLQPICKRTLRRQVLEYINYTNRIALVEDFTPYDEETQLYNLVSDYLREEKLYALPMSQRHLMTLILRKLLASSSFAIEQTLEGLAKKLDAILKEQEEINEKDFLNDFETFDELAEEWNGEENEAEQINILSDEEVSEIKDEKERLLYFASLAKAIVKNSKGEKLLTALSKGFEKLNDIGASRKAIIFTESTRTQSYLHKLLVDNGYDNQLVLFNGSNNDPQSKEIYNKWIERYQGTDKITGSRNADKRQAIVDYFREEATIMIATEAAAEGINLQFCSLVVNYDLPWNPQRVEQRIGRCHRYGQKFDVVVINFLNNANAADKRVYELLDRKFKLFDGVFGASDEVLGSLESGVDFEKRIARIYQECRTTEEIEKAFDNLQNELEPEIQTKLESTRKQLLENFDEEVHEKLKMNLEKGQEYLSKYETWLWNIAKHYLGGNAIFNDAGDSFRLKRNPFKDENIHEGPYKLIKSSANVKKSEVKVEDDTNIFRIGHPLAQRIIRAVKKKELQVREVVFDYTNTNVIITLLEPFIGQSGWLKASVFSIQSFEKEEYIIFSAFTDENRVLEAEQARRMFSLSAREGKTISIPNEVKSQLEEIDKKQKQEFTEENMHRNAQFFDEEYEKLDNWADDMKLSLEKEIKDLDAEIKLKKSEAKKVLDLQKKVAMQRKIKEMEKKRSKKRQRLFEAQDEVDKRKDELLSDVEERLKQKITAKELFTIRWKII